MSVSLAGLGQVLEFMYTAKLSLSSENVDDVLAVDKIHLDNNADSH